MKNNNKFKNSLIRQIILAPVFNTQLVLTANNLQHWKRELNRYFKYYWDVDNYSDCNYNEDWLRDYSGATIKNAVNEEIENWEE